MLGLDDISPIILGGGAWNNRQYGADTNLEPKSALKMALTEGINAIDTSAYYGDSEIIIGEALKSLAKEFPRESYMISTKAGRWENNVFDYTSAAIRSSVTRSLERLGTSYLDILLIHDVEFKTMDEGIEALKTAFDLKAEGKVRFVGFSGLPLEYMSKLAQRAHAELQSVDVILSYCNLTLQNTLLLKYKSIFESTGVKLIINASPLSMSLLRSAPTHDWHPASQAIKDKTQEIAQELLKTDIELADLAEQFAFSALSPTVVGMRSTLEVGFAMENLKKSKVPNNKMFQYVHNSYGDLKDVSWPSGIHLA